MNAVTTAEKKSKGRKRHIVTDTMGNLLAVSVHAANIHDTVFGLVVAAKAFECYHTIKGFCGDDGYRKTFECEVAEELGLFVNISKRIKPEFEVIPKRWVVERTFGWLTHSRRLSKDYEIRTDYAEAVVVISHLHTLLKRL
jgi:putative transposase